MHKTVRLRDRPKGKQSWHFCYKKAFLLSPGYFSLYKWSFKEPCSAEGQANTVCRWLIPSQALNQAPHRSWKISFAQFGPADHENQECRCKGVRSNANMADPRSLLQALLSPRFAQSPAQSTQAGASPLWKHVVIFFWNEQIEGSLQKRKEYAPRSWKWGQQCKKGILQRSFVSLHLIFALAGHSWKNLFSVIEDQIKLAKSPES